MTVFKNVPLAVCLVGIGLPAISYGQDVEWLTWDSHEALVETARAESGTLNVSFSHNQPVVDEVVNLFKQAYDFANVTGQEVGDADPRILLELQAGVHRGDVVHIEEEEGLENYYPNLLPVDLLAMSESGLLDIPVEMINPEMPMVAAFGTSLSGVAYNSDTLPEHLVPTTYEDLLDPELTGSGLLWADVSQATGIASLFVVWGEERMLEYARQIGEQKPVWTTGATASLTAMAAGEYAIGTPNHYHTAVRIQERGTQNLQAVLLEPVPVRLTQILGINRTTSLPATATLFLEFTASAEVQEIFNRMGPIQGSVFVEGSRGAGLVEGKEIAFVGWDDMGEIERLQTAIFEAWGFPIAAPN